MELAESLPPLPITWQGAAPPNRNMDSAAQLRDPGLGPFEQLAWP